MQSDSAENLKRRLTDLGRGAPKAHPPVFAPMLFSIAGEIEGMCPEEFVCDTTKMVRAGSELAGMLGLGTVFTGAPCGAIAQAFGATLDQSNWPFSVANCSEQVPAINDDLSGMWARSPILMNFIEATRNLDNDEGNSLLPMVAIEGPSILASQIFGADGLTEDRADTIGAILAALIREFAEAGSVALVVIDNQPSHDAWGHIKAAYRTMGNVARFHRVPLVSVLQDTDSPADISPILVPAFGATSDVGQKAKMYARALSECPETWPEAGVDDMARFITTMGEVPADTGVETVARYLTPIISSMSAVD